MKDIYILTVRDGDGVRHKQEVTIGKAQDPEVVVPTLIKVKNLALMYGEEPITLINYKKKIAEISYVHDWKKVGDHYVCMDCKIPGDKANPFANVVPRFKHPKYVDCKWKIKPE